MLNTPKNRAYFYDLEDVIKAHLVYARKRVRICVAWVNYDRYAYVFSELINKGVSIEIIVNDDHSNQDNFPDEVEGLHLKRLSSRQGFMHHKFCVIDDHMVLRGSFNWSENANRHYENLEVASDDFPLASAYTERFEELWEVASVDDPDPIICGFLKDDGKKCRAHAFHLGIIGDAEGVYRNCNVTVWRVCYLHQHAQFMGESHEDHLLERLGLNSNDYPDWDDEGITVDSEAARRTTRQNAMRAATGYFTTVTGVPVNALGRVMVMNEIGHLQFHEDPEYGVITFWRDVHNADRIRAEYKCDGSGIENVIFDYRHG